MEQLPPPEDLNSTKTYLGPGDPIGIWVVVKKGLGIHEDELIIADFEKMAAVREAFKAYCDNYQNETDMSQVLAKPPHIQDSGSSI